MLAAVGDEEARLLGIAWELGQPLSGGGAIWADFERRAAVYNGALAELGGFALDDRAVHGQLPAEVAARVSAQPLETDLLRVSLRGYQAFGARFALAQRRVILGDEMGLGKTIEAIAVAAHLQQQGGLHTLVVCPASVIINWVREIRQHSLLEPHSVHGPDREQRLREWRRAGGVAVTTYDTLKALPAPDQLRVDLLIADEAHYAKNATAQRTKALRSWLRTADRALLLTGTPMENRVEEFRTLVRHVQPEVAARLSGDAALAGSDAFRAAVATVYLRRNQVDVLDELPERIESEEWVELSAADAAEYRQAVAARHFQGMRQAAFAAGPTGQSAKLARLLELVDAAVDNGHKVVVFSFFRSVISTVREALGDLAVGEITGSVTPMARQQLIDEFTEMRAPAVLVSQIEAGGVGLNIQAANVVLLTEPQWKPSTEEQAIARCHRMGQVRRVEVYRLLAEGSVDQRMLEVLAGKRLLFDEYVRRSELKDVAPEAVDVSDSAATLAVAQSEAERQIIEAERRRLGIGDDEPE